MSAGDGDLGAVAPSDGAFRGLSDAARGAPGRLRAALVLAEPDRRLSRSGSRWSSCLLGATAGDTTVASSADQARAVLRGRVHAYGVMAACFNVLAISW